MTAGLTPAQAALYARVRAAAARGGFRDVVPLVGLHADARVLRGLERAGLLAPWAPSFPSVLRWVRLLAPAEVCT